MNFPFPCRVVKNALTMTKVIKGKHAEQVIGLTMCRKCLTFSRGIFQDSCQLVWQACEMMFDSHDETHDGEGGGKGEYPFKLLLHCMFNALRYKMNKMKRKHECNHEGKIWTREKNKFQVDVVGFTVIIW